MENIDIDKSIFNSIMEYFKDQKEEMYIIKQNEQWGIRTIDAYYTSTSTYTNLLTLVRGSIGIYRSILLLLSTKDEMVPALHCNQSSIQGLFSWIRGMGKDITYLYASGILQ